MERCIKGILILLLGLAGGARVYGQESNDVEMLPTQAIKPARLLGDPAFHHAATVTHVVALPDGKRVLSSARDGTARLWDLKTGEELQRFYHPDGEDVWNVCLGPAGKTAFASGEDKKVTQWDLETGKLLRAFEHAKTVFRAAIAPDGKTFASVDSEGVCKVWDLNTGKQRTKFKPSSDSLYTCAYSADGKFLMAAGEGDLIHTWNLEAQAQEGAMDYGQEDVYTLNLSPDGKSLLSCTEKKGVQLLSKDADTVTWMHSVPEDNVRCGAWAPDGKTIAIVGDDGKIRILDAENGALKRSIDLKGSTHYGVSFSQDGKQVLSGVERMVCRFDVNTGERIFPAKGDFARYEGMRSVAIDEKSDTVFECDVETGVRLMDLRTGAERDTWLADDAVRVVHYIPQTRQLLATGNGGEIWQIDAKTGKTIRILQQGTEIQCLGSAGSGKFIVAADSEDHVKIWRLTDGKCLHTLSHDNDINYFTASPSGKTLVVCTDKQTLKFWDLESGKESGSLVLGADVACCIFNPADKCSMLAAAGTEVYYWHVKTARTATLTKEEVAALVDLLGAASYKDRRAATTQLIQAGDAALEKVDASASDDPEVKMRLREIRAAVGAEQSIKKDPVSLDFGRKVAFVSFHPQGKYWAAIIGADASAEIALGVIRDGQPVLVGRYRDGHAPWALRFSLDGRELFTANRDGTISVFKTQQLTGD